MRVSTHAMTNAGAAAPAVGGLQAPSDVDPAFAALLAAALPQTEASAAEPLPLTAAAPSAQDSTEAESLLPDAEHELAAIIDPALLALIPDARTVATPTSPASPGTAATLPADAAASSSAKALPPVQAGIQELPAASAGDKLARHAKTDTAAASLPDVQAASTPRPQHESATTRLPHASSGSTEVPVGLAQPGLASLPASAAAAAAPAATAHVAAPVASDRWGQALGERVLWMAHKDVQSASLTLNPPELGPVKVELQLQETQAVASFSSAQPEVRKALEDALPALKAMFAEAGLDLRQADVGGDNARSRHAPDGQAQTSHGKPADAAPAAIGQAAPIPTRLSRGLLDTFA